MKKNILIKLGLLLLVASMFLAGCGSGGASSANGNETYELSLNVSASASSPFVKEVAERWATTVEEESDGRLKVNVYSGATLGALSSGYADIEGGVYEAGFIIPGLHTDTDVFPFTLADIPFLLQSPEVAEKVMTKYQEKFLTDVSKDVTFIGATSTDSYQLFGPEALKSPKDMKNQKVSDTVAGRIDLLEAHDAVPVSISNADLYESLERGVTDYAVYTAVGSLGYKFDEVTKWMTKVDMAVSFMPFYINTAFLDSLPEDLRELLVNDLGPKFTQYSTELYTKNSEKSVAKYGELLADEGGGVYVPTEQELLEWKSPVKEQMEEWVKTADERGYDGQAMMDYYIELLEAEGVEIPQ